MARAILQHHDLDETHAFPLSERLRARFRGIRARCGCESCKASRARVTRANALRRSSHAQLMNASLRFLARSRDGDDIEMRARYGRTIVPYPRSLFALEGV